MQCKRDTAGQGHGALDPTVAVASQLALVHGPVVADCGAASEPPIIRVGTVVGAYQVMAPLARGGMGAVFVARHLALGRTVAIKFLRRRLFGDIDAVERFFAEAVATGRLSHPGVVSLFEVGHHQGSTYLVMELLPGESLSARLARKGRLPIDEALDIGIQLAKALAAAHAAGIVHRDIKPDNIHLVPDSSASGFEYVKLLDFGIAKLTEAPGDPSRTCEGSLLGTPHYMAPEQCQHAGEVDQRSDIYSLGCVLFRLIAGRVPFSGSVIDVLMAHRNEPAPLLRAGTPSVPRVLERLIARMLSKQPDDRPQSMAQVARELRAIADGVYPRAATARLAVETTTWAGQAGYPLGLLILILCLALVGAS